MSFEKITEKSSLYENLEKKSIHELLVDINNEDKKVPGAVEKAIPPIVYGSWNKWKTWSFRCF